MFLHYMVLPDLRQQYYLIELNICSVISGAECVGCLVSAGSSGIISVNLPARAAVAGRV